MPLNLTVTSATIPTASRVYKYLRTGLSAGPPSTWARSATTWHWFIFVQLTALHRVFLAPRQSAHNHFVCAAQAAILCTKHDTAIAHAATETTKVPHPSSRLAPIAFLLAAALSACSQTSEKSSVSPALGDFGIDMAQMNTQEKNSNWITYNCWSF